MPKPSNPERDRLIYKMKEKGKSYTELARIFKVDRRAIFEAYWKVAAIQHSRKPPKSAKKVVQRAIELSTGC